MINEDKDTQCDARRHLQLPITFLTSFTLGLLQRIPKQIIVVASLTFRGNVANDAILVTTLSGFDT